MPKKLESELNAESTDDEIEYYFHKIEMVREPVLSRSRSVPINKAPVENNNKRRRSFSIN